MIHPITWAAGCSPIPMAGNRHLIVRSKVADKPTSALNHQIVRRALPINKLQNGNRVPVLTLGSGRNVIGATNLPTNTVLVNRTRVSK